MVMLDQHDLSDLLADYPDGPLTGYIAIRCGLAPYLRGEHGTVEDDVVRLFVRAFRSQYQDQLSMLKELSEERRKTSLDFMSGYVARWTQLDFFGSDCG